MNYSLVVRQNSHKTDGLDRRLGIPQTAVASGLEVAAALLSSGKFIGFLPLITLILWHFIVE